MKKKSRRPRSSEAPRRTSRTKTTGSVGGEEEEEEEKKVPGNRGRPRKTAPGTAEGFYGDDTAKGKTTKKHPERKSGSSGRLPAAVCRLCHGKFSPRSLRHAFHKWPQDSVDIVDDESDSAAQPPLLFHADFQRLVGVKLDRDPQLSEFICKKCHSKFYKCHSVLVRFLQRVNLPAVGPETLKTWKKCPEASVNYDLTTPKSFSSDPKCLHSLVSWAHHHGEACTSSPNLKEVLEDQYWGWGSVKAVWACVDGHRYIMDTQCSAPANSQYTMSWYGGALGGGSGDGVMSEEEEEQQPSGFGRTPAGSMSPLAQHSPLALTVQTASSALADWTADAEDFTGHDAALSPALARLEDAAADSDLSDRFLCEDDFGGTRKALSGEMLESFSDRSHSVTVPNKRRRRNQKTLKEPKIKKKPGPKPGWKNKFKPKGEELPNIYKCPYQGCTAVYKTPDGLKKHIKEHHEEVKERPCPHPGCNKVFMIDRYLQRHVKLIHTEERNHICDQCGQTFKQRKHLSVHQMRHSGAKPLQCEVCGFQCRQRASLKYHMTKHKAEADLDFACLMCEKRFEKAHNLNVHMSMVHPLIQAKVQRGSSQEPPPPEPPEPPPSYAELHADLHAITPTGEMVQQDQDR